jgi:hypothetical protein
MAQLSNDQVLARYMRATRDDQIALYARELEKRGL